MIRDMRLAAYLAKLHEGDAAAMPAEVMLEMADDQRARAMGIDDQVVLLR